MDRTAGCEGLDEKRRMAGGGEDKKKDDGQMGRGRTGWDGGLVYEERSIFTFDITCRLRYTRDQDSQTPQQMCLATQNIWHIRLSVGFVSKYSKTTKKVFDFLE